MKPDRIVSQLVNLSSILQLNLSGEIFKFTDPYWIGGYKNVILSNWKRLVEAYVDYANIYEFIVGDHIEDDIFEVTVRYQYWTYTKTFSNGVRNCDEQTLRMRVFNEKEMEIFIKLYDI